LKQIEKALNKEKREKEERLANDLKKRYISVETYDRKIKEVDVWYAAERKEIKTRQQKLEESISDVANYIDKISADRKNLTGGAKSHVSPKGSKNKYVNSRINVNALDNESDDSEGLTDAIRQTKMLESGLTGLSPEQRYLAKKREAALTLMEKKE
jgi:hypothetical protein